MHFALRMWLPGTASHGLTVHTLWMQRAFSSMTLLHFSSFFRPQARVPIISTQDTGDARKAFDSIHLTLLLASFSGEAADGKTELAERRGKITSSDIMTLYIL
jgi:hypothetical protein